MRTSLVALIGVAMVSAIGGLVFNTMPVLLGAVGEALSIEPAGLGRLSLFAGLGYLLGTLSAPIWVDRVPRRMAAGLFAILAAAAFALASVAVGSLLFAAFAGFGFFCALSIALAMRVIADFDNPERAFGTRLAVELISIGVFLALLPSIFVARYGLNGAMLSLAAFALLLGLGAFVMPKAQPVSDGQIAKTAFPSLNVAQQGYVMLGVFTLYLLVNVAVFFFLAVIAQDYSPEPAQLGLMFSVLKWLGGAAALIAALIGDRVGERSPHLVAFLILIAGVAMMASAQTFTLFMIGSWVWEFGFTLGCIYATAAISRGDASGKLVTLVPAAFGVSMLAGGFIGGQLLQTGSPMPLYAVAALFAVLPFLLSKRTRTAPEFTS